MINPIPQPTSNATTAAGTSPGDNNSSVAGEVDFDEILQKLYDIEKACDKSVEEMTQKVMALASASQMPTSTPRIANEMTGAEADSVESETGVVRRDNSVLAKDMGEVDAASTFIRAAQTYTQAQRMPLIDPNVLLAS